MLSVGLGFLVSVIEITVVDRIVLLAETIDVSFFLFVECPFALREFRTYGREQVDEQWRRRHE